MKRIIFVDDEPLVLAGLRRMLESLRGEWDMEFLSGGKEALTALAASPCDVIVSDIRMTGMDGAQLLAEVKRRYPETIRIALSGEADTGRMLEITGVTHQYLPKQCNLPTVKATIDRACALRGVLNDRRLQALIAELGSIPMVPALYREIRYFVHQNRQPQEIDDIFAHTPETARAMLEVLGTAFPHDDWSGASLSQAAANVGLDALPGVALFTEAFADLGKGALVDAEQLRQRSVRVGALARRIAQAENQPAKIVNLAQMAGLLHDVGKLVLSSRLPARYRIVMALQQRAAKPSWRCERGVFGQAHTEVGAWLLNAWGLPGPVVESAAFHHDPQKGAGETFSPLTAVYLADKLLDTIEDGNDPGNADFDLAYLARLRMRTRRSWLQAALEVAA